MKEKIKKIWAKLKVYLPLIGSIALVASMVLGLYLFSRCSQGEVVAKADEGETSTVAPPTISNSLYINTIKVNQDIPTINGELSAYGYVYGPTTQFLDVMKEGEVAIRLFDKNNLVGNSVDENGYADLFYFNNLVTVGASPNTDFAFVFDIDKDDIPDVNSNTFVMSYQEGDEIKTKTCTTYKNNYKTFRFVFKFSWKPNGVGLDGGNMALRTTRDFELLDLKHAFLVLGPGQYQLQEAHPLHETWYDEQILAYGEYMAEQANKDVEPLIEAARGEGYTAGYTEGFDLGTSSGHESGYNEGWSKGFSAGEANMRDHIESEIVVARQEAFNQGYDAGYEYAYNDMEIEREQIYETAYAQAKVDLRAEIENEVLNDKDMFLDGLFSIMDAPVRIIRDIFNFELFGINVASVVFFGLTMIIVFFVVKKLRGG